jgi:hypothetical protein
MSAERPAPPVPSLRGEDAGAEAPVSPPSAGGDGVRAVPAKPRCKPVNRAQMTWAAMDVERLVASKSHAPQCAANAANAGFQFSRIPGGLQPVAEA